jgi:hypothetical protein
MSSNSVPYNNIRMQEWINDPFRLGSNVKGLTGMSHKRNLENYAEQLVSHSGKYEDGQYELSFSELADHEQNELAYLYIEATDREVNECIYGNDFSINNDFTCALLAMLQDDCEETRERLSNVTRKNIITYYEKSLQTVLDDACECYMHSSNNDRGYYAHQDLEHGDIVWSKAS